MPHGLPPKLDLSKADQVSDLEWLLIEIERIQGCEATKRQVMAVLKAQTGKVIRFTYRALVRPDQVAHARKMLDEHLPTATIRDRLMTAHGCSVRHAYTLIQNAVESRGKEREAAMRAAQTDLFRTHATT